MMVWVTVPLVLPQSSVAFPFSAHFRSFPQVPAVVVSPRSCTVAPPQVSLAVGAVKVGEAGHSTVPSPPSPPIAGSLRSALPIFCVTVPLVLPQSSVAFQLLVEVYVFPHVPAVVVAPRSCTVAPPHVSEAVGAVKVGLAGHSTVPSAP